MVDHARFRNTCSAFIDEELFLLFVFCTKPFPAASPEDVALQRIWQCRRILLLDEGPEKERIFTLVLAVEHRARSEVIFAIYF